MQLLNKQDALEFVRQRTDLFNAAGVLNPFACSDWMLHFIEHIAEDDWSVTAAHCQDDGESLLLLYNDRKAPHRRAALSNCYSSLYSPLISSARDRNAALSKLVHDLVGQKPACAAIRFEPLDQEAPDTAALERAFADRGWFVRRYFCFGNWYLPCAGLSFNEFMLGRDSKMYNTWARKAKKFRPGAGRNARLEIVTDYSDAALDAYERVYAKSWKEPERYTRFVREWARICGRNGWLRLGIAWVGDVPVAAQFWFTMHRRAYIFKLAYDEDYSSWSAGTVLSAHMFQHSLEQDKVIEIDYLTGDDAYKRSWMSARRERIGLLACNPLTARGLVLTATELARDVGRRCRRVLSSRNNPGIAALP